MLKRLCETDFTIGWPRALLVASFVLVRLPLLGGGYGADTDAYRVALTARFLLATGEYLPSRLPGFPLHEGVVTLLLRGGPWLTNGATVAAGVAALLALTALVRELRPPAPDLVILGFAFTPYLVVTSSATLDYHFALAALLGCYLAAARGRSGWAGVLLGVAAGFRITSLLFSLPLTVMLLRRGHLPALLKVGLTATVVSAALYLPVALPYHFRFLDFADSRVSPDGVIRVVGQWSLGAVGALAVLGVLAWSWRRAAALPALARKDDHVLVWLTAVTVWTAAFLRLPVDLGYLIPIYPFGLLLLATVVERRLLAAVLATIMLAGFVDLDIQRLHNFDPRVVRETVRPSWQVAGIGHDQQDRRRWQRYAHAIASADLPPRTVVLTGGAFPVMAVEWWGRLRYDIVERDYAAISMLSDNGMLVDDLRDLVYLAVSTPHILERFRGEGYRIVRAFPENEDWSRVLFVDEER